MPLFFEPQIYANERSSAFICENLRLKFSQIATRHFRWLFKTKQTEQRRRDVFERAPTAELHSDRFFMDQVKRDGIGRVCGVRTAGHGIDHLLGVAVIGGDERNAARLANS